MFLYNTRDILLVSVSNYVKKNAIICTQGPIISDLSKRMHGVRSLSPLSALLLGVVTWSCSAVTLKCPAIEWLRNTHPGYQTPYKNCIFTQWNKTMYTTVGWQWRENKILWPVSALSMLQFLHNVKQKYQVRQALVWQLLEGTMGALTRNLGFILQEKALSKAYKEDGDKIRSRHKKGNSGDKFSRLDSRQN